MNTTNKNISISKFTQTKLEIEKQIGFLSLLGKFPTKMKD